MKQSFLSDRDLDQVIRMAWQDRTSFEEIHDQFGLSEAEVVITMRGCLKPASFRLWRQRTRGRITKHRKLSERGQAKRLRRESFKYD